MSNNIVKLAVSAISGALSKAVDAGEIFVAKGTKAPVALVGHIAGPREKGDDGKYVVTTFGRLPVKAAIAGEGDKRRYVLEIAGGFRGVMFPVKEDKKKDSGPDYTGSIELDDGDELPLFGRKIKSENGDFISLSSGERRQKAGGKSSNNGNGGDNGKTKAGAGGDGYEPWDDSSIPF